VFSLGGGRAAVVDLDGVKIVDRRRNGVLLFSDSNVIGVVQRGLESRVYVENHEGITWVDVSSRTVRSTSVVKPPKDSRFAGATGTGDMIFVGDTDEGSFIWKLTSEGDETVLASANEHMASIVIPEYRRVTYTANGASREGVLFLPTVQRLGDRPPVVVTAYPVARPIGAYLDYYSRVSGGVAWRWHPLLSAGFAVYLVDFRRPPAVRSDACN
jgi:dipeptidyl aminopeptidase/acylaminoacyl peptidase